MASVPDNAAPSLFLRNATGLVKGWSGFDAFSYSFMSVNLVTLGMFYSLAVFAYVPAANPILSIVLAAIAMTFLAVAYAGLIAAMPRAGGDYIWQSRILDGIPGTLTGAAVGGIGFFLVANAFSLGDTVAHRRSGRRCHRRRDHRPVEWRDRLRPGRHRVVVHPRDVGADLRRDPQHRVLPAAGGARQVRRRPGVLRFGERHPVRLDRDHRPDVAARGTRHGRLRADPEVVPLPRPHRPRHHVRADARSGQPDFKIAFDRANEIDVRYLRRLRQDARGCGRQRRLGDDARSDGFRDEHHGHPARDAGDDPVHALLDPVPELGFDAVRRGPRLGRFPQGPARHARRDLDHRRPRARVRAPRREDVRLGLLHRHQRELHQLLLRLHHDRPDGAGLELSAVARLVPDRQLVVPDRDDRAVRRVVPGLVGDAVPVVDPDDLRRGLRPGAPRPRGPGLRTTGRAGHRAALHHGPGGRGQRDLCLLGRLPGPDAGRDAGHRSHVPRQCDRGRDPALVQAADLRQLAGRAPQARHQWGRLDHRDHPGLDDHPLAQGPALRDRRRQRRIDQVPRHRLRSGGRCSTSSHACIAVHRASTSTPSIRRSRPNRAGLSQTRRRRLGIPGRLLDSAVGRRASPAAPTARALP